MSNARGLTAATNDATGTVDANYDPFSWSGGTSGAWGDAANWTDRRTGKPNGVPGATNAVAIGSMAGGAITVTGPGQAAQIIAQGTLTLSGSIGVGGILQSGTGGVGATQLFIEGAGASVSAARWQEYSGAAIGAGASLRANAATLFGPGADTLDAAGRLEIGSGGAPAAGVWTIDANGQLADTGATLIASSFLENGRFVAYGNVALENHAGGLASVAGTGQLDIGAGGTLHLGQTSASNAVYFRNTGGVGGTLALDATSFDASHRFDPYVRGFTTLDAISVSGVTFDGAVWSRGTLALTEGGTTVDTILLPGQLSGDVFSVSNGTVTAQVLQPGTFDWAGGTAGVWGNAGNWLDDATGKPAARAPGVGDTAQIFGGSTPISITGPGAAADLALSVGTAIQLDGTFAAPLIACPGSMDNYGYLYGASVEVAGAGSRLSLTDAGIVSLTSQSGGSISISGDYAVPNAQGPYSGPLVFSAFYLGAFGAGSSVSVGGTVTATTDFVYAGGGATFHAAGAVLSDPIGYASLAPIYYVDDTSTFEVGSAGGAKAGRLTVDQGATLWLDGAAFDAPSVLDNGTIRLSNDATVDPNGLGGPPAGLYNYDDALKTEYVAAPITGTGTVELDDGVSGDVLSGSPSLTVAIAGADVALTIAATGSDAFTDLPRVTGFASGDTLFVAGATYDAASWANNVLTLSEHGAVVGTLDVIGSYAADTFYVDPTKGDAIELLGPGQNAPNIFYWKGSGTGATGDWNTPSNWAGTAGTSFGTVPNNTDAVYLGDSTGAGLSPAAGAISGNGTASYLTADGTYTLTGDIEAGQIRLDAGADLISASTTAHVPNVYTLDSNVTAFDGAGGTLTATDDAFYATATLDVGAAGESLQALNGGTVNVNATFARDSGAAVTIKVDATSIVEIGTGQFGTVLATGALTVEKIGPVLDNRADIIAPTIVDYGTIVANGTFSTPGGGLANVTGSGEIDVHTLAMGSGSSTLAIKFLGGTDVGDTLQLAAASLDNAGTFDPMITGFGSGAGDAIDFAQTITNADWASGLLQVSNGTTHVATLHLSGNYAGAIFDVSHDAITVVLPHS